MRFTFYFLLFFNYYFLYSTEKNLNNTPLFFIQKFHYSPNLKEDAYFIDRLAGENKQLQQSLLTERKLNNKLIIISSVLFITLLFLSILYYRKQISSPQHDLQIEQRIPTKEFRINENNTVLLSEIDTLPDMNPLVVEKILNYLNYFEKEKKFLSPETSLLIMAKECGTNPSYLSKVINHYKQNNFISYLNELRLHYAQKLWETDPKLRHSSIQEMAAMAGFKTTQSFSKNFQQQFAITPTQFLKNLEHEKLK